MTGLNAAGWAIAIYIGLATVGGIVGLLLALRIRRRWYRQFEEERDRVNMRIEETRQAMCEGTRRSEGRFKL